MPGSGAESFSGRDTPGAGGLTWGTDSRWNGLPAPGSPSVSPDPAGRMLCWTRHMSSARESPLALVWIHDVVHHAPAGFCREFPGLAHQPAAFVKALVQGPGSRSACPYAIDSCPALHHQGGMPVMRNEKLTVSSAPGGHSISQRRKPSLSGTAAGTASTSSDRTASSLETGIWSFSAT